MYSNTLEFDIPLSSSTRLLRDDAVHGQLLVESDPVADPVEDGLVPQQAILPVGHPVALVREMQEPRGYAQTLEDVEGLQALCLDNTVVQFVVDDELGCASVAEIGEGIPAFVVVAVVPDGAVVVVLDEPDLVGGVGADLVDFAVVADECFELAAEGVALDPVDHVAAE